MRLSMHEGDPGFLTYRQLEAQGKEPMIFLNGELIECVMTADEERGFVTFVKSDITARTMMAMGEEVATDILYGEVKIVTEDA